MTANEVRLELTRAVAAAGGVRAFARAHDLSSAYVSDVMRGNRAPGPGIALALGLRRVVEWRRA